MPSARRLAQHERLLQPVAGNAELVRYGQLRPARVCTQLFERPLALGLPRSEHQGNRLEETYGNHSPDNPNPEHGDSALDDEGASLLHSDMSRRYQMLAYRLALERMGAVRSMPRKGNRLDNAKAENFFSMVKTELYCDWRDDPDIFEGDLERYIDWYGNVRIKRRLNGSGPVECRLGRAA